MPFPKLKQLSDGRLSPHQLADLLQQHIGDGSNEFHCEQAYKALERIRNEKVREAVFAVIELSRGFAYSQIIRDVIYALRGLKNSN